MRHDTRAESDVKHRPRAASPFFSFQRESASVILVMQANVLICPFLPDPLPHSSLCQQTTNCGEQASLNAHKNSAKNGRQKYRGNTQSSCFDFPGIWYDNVICLVTFPYLISVFITTVGSLLAALEATADVQAVQNYLIVYLNDVANGHFKCTMHTESSRNLSEQVVATESGNLSLLHVDIERLNRVYHLLIASHDTGGWCNREMCSNGPVYFEVERNLASHPHPCHMLVTLLTFPSVGILHVLTMWHRTAETVGLFAVLFIPWTHPETSINGKYLARIDRLIFEWHGW